MLVKLRFFILLYISNSYLEVTILPIGAFLWEWIFCSTFASQYRKRLLSNENKNKYNKHKTLEQDERIKDYHKGS